jgi:hypothetical protein
MPDIVHDIELRIDGTAQRDQSGGVARKKTTPDIRARRFLLFALGGRDHDAGRAIYLSPRGRS